MIRRKKTKLTFTNQHAKVNFKVRGVKGALMDVKYR